MARVGISKEDVIKAAENLLAEGKSPTVINVRQALGNTGSNTTINKHLSHWKTKKLSVNVESSTEAAVVESTQGLDLSWLNQQTHKAFMAIEKQCEAKIQSMFDGREEISQKLYQAEQEINHLHTQVEEYQLQAEAAKRLELDLQAMRIELAEAKHQIEFHKQQSASTETEKSEGSNTAVVVQKALKKLLSEQAVIREDVETILEHLTEVQDQEDEVAEDVAEDHSIDEEEHEYLAQEMAQLEMENQRLERELDELGVENQRLKAELESSKEESESLKGSMTMFREKLLELEML